MITGKKKAAFDDVVCYLHVLFAYLSSGSETGQQQLKLWCTGIVKLGET